MYRGRLYVYVGGRKDKRTVYGESLKCYSNVSSNVIALRYYYENNNELNYLYRLRIAVHPIGWEKFNKSQYCVVSMEVIGM